MIIRTARDAETFLLNCWHDHAFGDDKPVTFDGCALTITLDPGNGTADAKALRAMRLLQHHLNLTYALAKTGSLKARLTDFEKDRLSTGFGVRPGSTILQNDIAGSLRAMQSVLPAHWSTRTKNMIACGVLLAMVTLPFLHEYTNYRTETDRAHIAANASIKVAHDINRTNYEIAKLNAPTQTQAESAHGQNMFGVADTLVGVPEYAVVLASLAKEDPSNVVGFALSDYVSWRPAIMASAPYGGTLRWGDSAPIPARVAKAIATKERKVATAARRVAKENGQPGLIDTPWVTEVLRTHEAPGAMRLGLLDA